MQRNTERHQQYMKNLFGIESTVPMKDIVEKSDDETIAKALRVFCESEENLYNKKLQQQTFLKGMNETFEKGGMGSGRHKELYDNVKNKISDYTFKHSPIYESMTREKIVGMNVHASSNLRADEVHKKLKQDVSEHEIQEGDTPAHFKIKFKNNEIEKGGFGSGRHRLSVLNEKENKELGKTKSGKTIYSHSNAMDYTDFTDQDHKDAIRHHMKEYDDPENNDLQGNKKRHLVIAQTHAKAAGILN